MKTQCPRCGLAFAVGLAVGLAIGWALCWLAAKYIVLRFGVREG